MIGICLRSSVIKRGYQSAILLCVLFISQTVFAIALHDSQDRYHVAADAYYLEDINNNIDYEIVKTLPKSQFIKNKVDTISLGYSSASYWIKVDANYFSKNGYDLKYWFLEIATSSLDELDIYIIDQGNTTSHHLGDRRAFSSRPVQHNNYIVDFRTSSKQTTNIYIRVKNSSAIELPIRVWSHEALFAESKLLNYLAGICYGILLVLIIYNLILFFVARDKSHNYLSMYILCLLVCLMSYDGFAKLVLWPNSLWWESRALFFWEALAIFWGVQFLRIFLKERLKNFLLDRTLFYSRFIVIFLVIYTLIYSTNMYSIYLLLAYAALSVWPVIIGLQLESKVGKIYFLLAWVSLYIVSALLLLGLFGVDAVSTNKIYLYYVGAITHGLFLSLALTDRCSSAKKKQEQAEHHAISTLQRYKDLFTNSTAGMFECTYKGDILHVNPALIDMFGYGSEAEMLDNSELLGSDIFLHKADSFKYLRSLLKDMRVNNFEFEFIRKNGELGWGSVSSRLVPSTKPDSKYNIEGSIVDITASKDREAIEKKLIETETSANIKSQFLANSSHELRTPMNAIIGFTSLLQKTDLSEKQYSYTEKVRVSAKGLLRLINDILDHSKLEAGEMQLEIDNFNLDQVISEVIDVFSERFNDKGIELIIIKDSSVPVNLKGDPLRISQVLINLINNAMKFTNEGHVAIVINHSEITPSQIDIKITISDTGIGIDSDRLQAIFEPYQQAETSIAANFGGTGLGLSLCKKLIESMGGVINVTSQVGKGTEFEFHLLLQTQEVDNIVEQNCYEILKEKSGFIIDSNKLTRKQLQNDLNSLGITSMTVSSGEMALQRLISLGESENYDFIIVERNLIDNNGINLIKDLKTESTTKNIPIILTSRTGFSDLSERDRNSGINEFLVKPIQANMLLKSLVNIFNLDHVKLTSQETTQIDKYTGIFCGKDILLVEDNELNQELFIELLKETDAFIDVANTGMMALEKVQKNSYSLILMDVQMPVLNGIETTKIIRQDYPEFEKLPILALTANVLDEDRNECITAGMDGFITKPIDFEDLICTLKTWLPKSDIQPNSFINKLQINNSNTTFINLESGLKKLGGNKRLYYKILQDFMKTYSEEKNSILQLRASGEYAKLQIKIHSIKGLSYNLGLDSLGDIAKNIEKMIIENPNTNIGLIDHNLSRFFNCLSGLEQQIPEPFEE